MHMNKPSISDELHVVRYGNGIKLLEPDFAPFNQLHNIGTIKRSLFSFYLLNIDSSTLFINEAGAICCGFGSVKDSIGKTLFDVSKKESAGQLINNCSQVINNNAIKIFEEEIVRQDDVLTHFLSIKSPWYSNDNQILGTLGCSIILGKNDLASSLSEIRKLGLLDTDYQHPAPPEILNLSHLNIDLSRREKQCLYLTVKGYTAKRIARSLEISHRTVEEYLTNIRSKFGVSTKLELVEIVLDQLSI